jgi:hypothetical protein
MGTVSRKRPFSDLSETDLDEYERRIRAMQSLADVLREVQTFIKNEPEVSTQEDESHEEISSRSGSDRELCNPGLG